MIHLELLEKGKEKDIYEIVVGKKSEIEELIKKQDKATRSKINRLINELAEKGIILNTQRFKFEGDKIFAIKANQVRIYCFFDSGRLILLTSACIKKKQKADPVELVKAKKIREIFEKNRKGLIE